MVQVAKQHVTPGHESKIIEPTVLYEKSGEDHEVLELHAHSLSLGL